MNAIAILILLCYDDNNNNNYSREENATSAYIHVVAGSIYI